MACTNESGIFPVMGTISVNSVAGSAGTRSKSLFHLDGLFGIVRVIAAQLLGQQSGGLFHRPDRLRQNTN